VAAAAVVRDVAWLAAVLGAVVRAVAVLAILASLTLASLVSAALRHLHVLSPGYAIAERYYREFPG
jgi:hypothetical protein